MSLMKWPGRRRTAPRAGWLKHVPDNELEVLIALADLGTLPPDAQLLYADIQTRAETSMKTTLVLPAPDNVTIPPDTSFAGILRIRWQNADASVRRVLRTVANALGIDVPLTRTQPVPAKDSPPTRRTKFELQPNHGVPARLASPSERQQPGYHDPPEYDDELADGWVSSESLTDALHDALDPADRGWY